MRSHRSLGGRRIRPGPPQFEEAVSVMTERMGVFNDGLDRLRSARELPADQREWLASLPHHAPLKSQHRNLLRFSDHIWNAALEHQLALHDAYPTSHTQAIGQTLIDAAGEWQRLSEAIQQEMAR